MVIPPPVQMHGDTLEFSARAFSLDSNAVAEDLLKKLPGVIVWGDGSITVNGKQISKLLVDGKPFFGADAVVATQNIPKSAIEKVQVYQEFVDPNNPLDSITDINLKLRTNNHAGYFGALSVGAGDSGKYEVSANNSFFSPRNQFALVAQSNNVNKMGNDINTLLRNNTFRGISAHVDYQPDFSLPGINHQTSGGLLFTHDFGPDFNQYKQDRLSINSFFSSDFNNTTNQVLTTSTIGDSSLQQNSYDDEKKKLTELNFDARYNKLNSLDSIMFEGICNFRMNNSQKSLQNQVYSSTGAFLSNDSQYDNADNFTSKIGFQGAYDHRGFYSSATRKLTNWSLGYSVFYKGDNLNQMLKTDFVSNLDSLMDLFYDRKYNNSRRIVEQNLTAQLGDFSSWLFGDDRNISRFHIVVRNESKYSIEYENNIINNGDTLGDLFQVNGYLSKIGSYKVFNETPDLKIGRNFMNILANRYQREFDVYTDSKFEIVNENNSSNHLFQDFVTNYHSFIPSLMVGYSNFQYGDFLDSYNLGFNLSHEYPTPDQRVPLVDSADVYNIREGNAGLK